QKLGAREMPPGAESIRESRSATPLNHDELTAIPRLDRYHIQPMRMRLRLDPFQAIEKRFPRRRFPGGGRFEVSQSHGVTARHVVGQERSLRRVGHELMTYLIAPRAENVGSRRGSVERRRGRGRRKGRRLRSHLSLE